MTPCIYTSESRSLAILEYSVNVNVDEIPRALCMVTFEIDENDVYALNEADLPGNWKSPAIPKETQFFGTKLLRNPGIAVIRIPSTVIPEEFNYIINPLRMQGKIKISQIRDYIYDIRLKIV